MITFGIIGYGKMGAIRHKAIADSRLGNVKYISDKFLKDDIDLPNINNDDIINNNEVDSIIICTPNYLNKELTIKALNAGKHVFCEKPPCFTHGDMMEIIEAERKSGRKLMYGFNHRHHDSVIRMKEIVDSGNFGRILWMRGRYGKSVTPDYYNEWRAKKELAGGGILIDQGIHMLDLFLHLGSDFDDVKAEVSNLYWNLDVEDNAFVILKDSQTGLVANLHSTMTQWRHLFSLEVFMEKGYMVLNGLNTTSMSYGDEILSIAKNRTAAPAATWEDEVKTHFHGDNSWKYEIDHFIDAIINNKTVDIGNSTDALKLMKIMDRIYSQKAY